jgi:hypothetical protein
MEHITDVKNWQWIGWVVIIISFVIKLYYYSKIKFNKNAIEFLMDYFHWAPIMMIKNIGADKARRAYMKINNRCMLTLWLMLLMQLILLFVEEKAKYSG